MSEKMRIGSGPPVFCWHCSKKLMRAPGKGQGNFYFNLVMDPQGELHRVHGGPCTAKATANGYGVLVKKVES